MKLKLKPRVRPVEASPEAPPAKVWNNTANRARRQPEAGMPPKRTPQGQGSAAGAPGYSGKGEPSHYNPEYIEHMYRFFTRDPWEVNTTEKGQQQVIPKDKLPTMARFAQQIGYNTVTLRNWTKRFPEFKAAYDECMELQKSFILESGGISLNGNFAAFMLRCNHGMIEPNASEPPPATPITKVEIEVVGAGKDKSN